MGDRTLYWEYNSIDYELESIPMFFKEMGYYTEAIHGDKETFYNRDKVYPELYGFDHFHALEDFIEEGYEDTTFQKIAERCGITRTILYLYFENKKQIFAESLKRFLGSVEIEIAVVAHDESMNSEEKILKIGEMVVEACEKESKLLSVVLDYLLRLKAAGGNPDEKVRRRTVRMRHILADIVIEGKKRVSLWSN